jgi:hypothetical protein
MLSSLVAVKRLAEELETKILRQAERAQTFLQFAGRHQILAAFVAGLGFRMIRRWLEATDHFLRVVPTFSKKWGSLARADLVPGGTRPMGRMRNRGPEIR